MKDYFISKGKIYYSIGSGATNPTVESFLIDVIKQYRQDIKRGEFLLQKTKNELADFIQNKLSQYIQEADIVHKENCNKDRILKKSKLEDPPKIYTDNERLGVNPKDFVEVPRWNFDSVRYYKCPKCEQYDVYIMNGLAHCENCKASNLTKWM